MNANEASENTIDEAFIPPSPLHAIKQKPENRTNFTKGDPIGEPTPILASIVELNIVILSTVEVP
jgi:hypothetical protein